MQVGATFSISFFLWWLLGWMFYLSMYSNHQRNNSAHVPNKKVAVVIMCYSPSTITKKVFIRCEGDMKNSQGCFSFVNVFAVDA